jgi:hypothetical protein
MYGQKVRWNKVIVAATMLASWLAFLPTSVNATTSIPDSYLQPTMSRQLLPLEQWGML